MSDSSLQAKIDKVQWYHEFDFGNGLKARSTTADVEGHRRVWRFIEHNLGQLDFRGKSVLDVGCWDGYWSFFAERRGAKNVLASDDLSQSWAEGSGLHLAKELLNSSIDINQNLSVHELGKQRQTFDVILCLGVYYHLISPFHAFAQLRHCCHPNTLVVIEGDVGRSFLPNEARFAFDEPGKSEFIPSEHVLEKMVRGAYLNITKTEYLSDFLARGRPLFELLRIMRRSRWRIKSHLFGGRYEKMLLDRNLILCTPFQGVNPIHQCKPPFGLDVYDHRFQQPAHTADAA